MTRQRNLNPAFELVDALEADARQCLICAASEKGKAAKAANDFSIPPLAAFLFGRPAG